VINLRSVVALARELLDAALFLAWGRIGTSSQRNRGSLDRQQQ
jgi:predicted DNA-binding WGR domain protein